MKMTVYCCTSTSASAPVRGSWTTSCREARFQQYLCLYQRRCFCTSLPVLLPFILDPIGSPPLLIRTHALSSNLTTLPSSLWYFLIVRTTTACLMSPLLTLFAALIDTLPPGPDSGPKFLCFCTTTMMRSPGMGISRWSGKVVLSYLRREYVAQHIPEYGECH